MKIVMKDIFDAPENEIICHQVNCCGKMNAGLAKVIRNKFPEVYEEYMKFYNSYTPQYNLIGECQLVITKQNRIIANLFGQIEYGSNSNIVYTKYYGLKNAFKYLVQVLERNPNVNIAIPYFIGCGHANGNWNIVYKIISEVFYEYEDRVTIYNNN